MMSFLIIFSSKYLIFILIAIFLVYFLNSKDKRKLIVKLALISSIAFVLSRLLGYFILMPRPFVHDGLSALFFHTPDNGFPSDHALLAFTLAMTLYIENRKLGVSFTLLAIMIGLARVLANVHHVTDVVGSFTIVLVAYVFSKQVQNFGKYAAINDLKSFDR